MPVLNKEAYPLVMSTFAKRVDAGEDHHVLVVQDGGRWLSLHCRDSHQASKR